MVCLVMMEREGIEIRGRKMEWSFPFGPTIYFLPNWEENGFKEEVQNCPHFLINYLYQNTPDKTYNFFSSYFSILPTKQSLDFHRRLKFLKLYLSYPSEKKLTPK